MDCWCRRGRVLAALDQTFADRAALTAHLLAQKFYAPTHESAAVTLMASTVCRLGEGRKLLALTFMNGARWRLDARLGENEAFRRRFDFQTFDVFARTLAAWRRSLITPEMQTQADALREFDGPCALAAGLLKNEAVL